MLFQVMETLSTLLLKPEELSSQGIMFTQEARIKLAKMLMQKGFKGDVPYPNIKTKADAQKLIGLDIPAEKAAKEKFKKELVPQWDAEAKARQDKSKK